MAEHICKICGAPLETDGSVSIVTCGKCGSVQTVFQSKDPKVEKLFEQAEQKRFAGEFAEAAKLYDAILEEDSSNPEAYWGNLLCSYGVTYEPGKSGENAKVRVTDDHSSTCTGNPNYIMALQFADDACDAVYKQQAQQINTALKENRKQNKKSRDCQVFICANPSSTGAVALAQKVYDYLLDKGVSVYYDDEGNLTFDGDTPSGDCAEMLEKASAILCCGSDPTDFQYQLIDQLLAYTKQCRKQGIRKKLIPVCLDVDLSELPRALIALNPVVIDESGDMTALSRKLDKYIGKHEEDEHDYSDLALSSDAAKECLTKGFNDLSAEKWGDAENQFDEVLIREPYSPYAYLGKLLAELELTSIGELNSSKVPFGDSPNYLKFLELADETLADEIRATEKSVSDRCHGVTTPVKPPEGSSKDPAVSGTEQTKNSEEKSDEPTSTGTEPVRNWKPVAVILAALTSVCLLVFLITQVIIPGIHYSNADNLLQEGQYEAAAEQFRALGSYRDSKERLLEILHSPDYLRQLNIGDTVYFGSYESDNISANGAETLEWYVTEKTDSKMTLLSVKAVDCKPYHDKYASVTWETSSIREWLNSDFYDAAFSEEEKAMIVQTEVVTPNNKVYGTSGGNTTTDRVFLPSMEEITSYFAKEEQRICTATDYALANSGDADVYWWLRNTGVHNRFACSVLISGEINMYGYYVNYGDNYVRPMICLGL